MRLAYFIIQRAESQGLFSILSRFFTGFAQFLPGKARSADRSGEGIKGKKKYQRFWKKDLTNSKESCIMKPALGRLAQLVEHALDVRRVSGSSPLSSTTYEKSELLPIGNVFGFSSYKDISEWCLRPEDFPVPGVFLFKAIPHRKKCQIPPSVI